MVFVLIVVIILFFLFCCLLSSCVYIYFSLNECHARQADDTENSDGMYVHMIYNWNVILCGVD